MDAALQNLVDENEIRNAIVTMSLGMDTLDVDLFASAFSDPLYADIPPLGGDEIRLSGQLRRLDYATNVIDLMRGFTAVQHVSTNHLFNVDGDVASCRAYVLGTHFLDEEADPWLTVGAIYTFQARRFASEGWRIERFKVTQLFRQGNNELWSEVTKRAIARRTAAGR
jgi:hypothetical protein